MSIKYIVFGKVRGVISHHVTLGAAVKARDKDRRACKRLGGGAYSDARVHVYSETHRGVGEAVSADELEAAGYLI